MASRRLLDKPCFNVVSACTTGIRPLLTEVNGRTVTTLVKGRSLNKGSSFAAQRRAATWGCDLFFDDGRGRRRPLGRELTSMNMGGVGTGTEIESGSGSGSGTKTKKSEEAGRKGKVEVLTLLYDGECPLCVKEVNMLRRRSDERGGTLGFIDIADLGYEELGVGVDYETAMGKIHAVRPDGSIVVGVQVFRDAYEAVGLGWVYTVLRVPGAPWLADKVYDLWADKRLEWTGRDALEAIVQARKDKRSCK